jgi:hypothetical protein
MTNDERKVIWLAGFDAGWGRSGEGWNAEYPQPNYEDEARNAEIVNSWIKQAEEDWQEYLKIVPGV